MHEAALAQAALPAPTVILGMALRPYALGHELFLLREENPLALFSDDRTATAPALVQAVLICCQSFEECKGMQHDIFLGLKMKLWKWRSARNVNLLESLQQFRTYQMLGALEFPKSPVTRPGQTPGRSPGSPFLLRLHQFVNTRLGIPHDAAWNYPFGLAKMQYQAFWEVEGGFDVFNEHDKEFDAFCERMEAEEAKKGQVNA